MKVSYILSCVGTAAIAGEQLGESSAIISKESCILGSHYIAALNYCEPCPIGNYCEFGLLKTCAPSQEPNKKGFADSCKPCERGLVSETGTECHKCPADSEANSKSNQAASPVVLEPTRTLTAHILHIVIVALKEKFARMASLKTAPLEPGTSE